MKSKTNPTLKNISEIERVKLDLLSLVSHELRTPLTGVLNALRALREEDLSLAGRQDFLEMAYRNAERLNATLGQLLDLSKLVSARLVCRFHEVSLKHLMISQLERFCAEAEKRGLEIKDAGVEDAIAGLPIVLGDAPRLEQVMRSLFENALKFSPTDGKISVRIRQGVRASTFPAGLQKRLNADNHFVALEIENLVPKEQEIDQEQVFKIFSQQEAVLDRVYEGVGGSLAIGAEVMRQHGGALYAETEKGRFTAWMILPMLESEQALKKVLESRMYALSTEVGEISLMILEVDKKSVKQVQDLLKALLFRASDTVYGLATEVVVVMNDCKKSDAPKIVRRLLENMGAESGKFLKSGSARVGLASCPDDATDPDKLLERARASLVPIAEF